MVEEGRRCVERGGQLRMLAALPGPAVHSRHSHHGISDQLGQFGGLPDVVAPGGAHQIAGRRGSNTLAGDAGFVFVAVQVHRAGQQVHRGNAIGQRMVHLADPVTPTETRAGSSPTGWTPPARNRRCHSSIIRGRTCLRRCAPPPVGGATRCGWWHPSPGSCSNVVPPTETRPGATPTRGVPSGCGWASRAPTSRSASRWREIASAGVLH